MPYTVDDLWEELTEIEAWLEQVKRKAQKLERENRFENSSEDMTDKEDLTSSMDESETSTSI